MTKTCRLLTKAFIKEELSFYDYVIAYDVIGHDDIDGI